DFENQEHKRFISQELKQFVNNELEELKSQQKLLRDRLKSIHSSFKNYVNYIAYWVILIPSLIFIIYAIYDYLIPRVNIKSNGESKQRTVKCNIADIFNNNVLLRIIGICSHFLFCAVVGPNALWIKIYLTAVA
ncbi:15468_t:CDS:2, partial [Gigaspora rosea]